MNAKDKKHNDNKFYKIHNDNKFSLKTYPDIDPEGYITKPSVYVDSDIPMNIDRSELIRKAPYNFLIEVAVYNSSAAVRKQAEEEITRRILSGEVNYKFTKGHEIKREEVVKQVLQSLQSLRKIHLESASREKEDGDR